MIIDPSFNYPYHTIACPEFQVLQFRLLFRSIYIFITGLSCLIDNMLCSHFFTGIHVQFPGDIFRVFPCPFTGTHPGFPAFGCFAGNSFHVKDFIAGNHCAQTIGRYLHCFPVYHIQHIACLRLRVFVYGMTRKRLP